MIGGIIDWESLYHSARKKLSEARELRCEAVRADTEELHKKMAYFERVHRTCVAELEQQNAELEAMISDTTSARIEIDHLQDSIAQLRRDIGSKDRTLRVIMQYPEIRVNAIDGTAYEIAVGENDAVVLRLDHTTQYTSEPIHVPVGVRLPQFIREPVTFREDALSGFCQSLVSFVRSDLR